MQGKSYQYSVYHKYYVMSN